MKPQTFVVLVASALVAQFANIPAGRAEPPPGELFGKTVLLSWTEYRVQKADAGDIRKSTTSSDFRVYISTAGRLFSRFSRENSGSGRSNRSAQGPEGNTTTAGIGQGPRTTHFERGQLVAENAMRSGARRIQAEFDRSYRSCALKVIYGKQAGAPLYHRGMDGRMYTIISTDIISPACSIKAGNLVGRE